MLEDILFFLGIMPMLVIFLSQFGLIVYIMTHPSSPALTLTLPAPEHAPAIEMQVLSRPKYERTTLTPPEQEEIYGAPTPQAPIVTLTPPATVPVTSPVAPAPVAPAPATAAPVTSPSATPAPTPTAPESDDVKYWLSLPFGNDDEHPIKDIFEALTDKGPLTLFSTDKSVADLPDWVHDTLLNSVDEHITLSTRGYTPTTYGKYRQDTRNLKVMTLVPTTYLPAELLTQSKYNLLSQTTVIPSARADEISRADVALIRSSIQKQLQRLKVPPTSYSHTFYISPDYRKLHIIINYHNPITGIDAKCTTSNILQEVRLLRSLMIVRSGTDYVF